MDDHEIVSKLIGPIRPIGETNIDNERFKNLKRLTILVDKLIYDIDAVIPNKTRVEFSMKRAGEFADQFFSSLGIGE
jgi:hypothetical protein